MREGSCNYIHYFFIPVDACEYTGWSWVVTTVMRIKASRTTVLLSINVLASPLWGGGERALVWVPAPSQGSGTLRIYRLILHALQIPWGDNWVWECHLYVIVTLRDIQLGKCRHSYHSHTQELGKCVLLDLLVLSHQFWPSALLVKILMTLNEIAVLLLWYILSRSSSISSQLVPRLQEVRG